MKGPHHHFADLMQFLILLMLFVILLVASPVGLRLAASVANNAGVGLDIQGVNGTLLNGLTMESLSWKGKGTTVELKDIELNLHETKYTDALNIKNLTASALNIYITSSSVDKQTYNVTIPDIPIPLDMVADHVQLDTLRIIRDRRELLFKIDDMAVENVAIVDRQLSATTAKASPIIAGSLMDIELNRVSVNFNQPHEMSGTGGIKYSHFQYGDFNGDITVGGTWTDYQLQGDINWDERILGQSQIQLSGFGDYDKATISSAIIDHSEGKFVTKGEMGWFENFSWKSAVQGSNVRTQKFAPQWPAIVDMDFQTSGAYSYEDSKWLMTLQMDALEGEVDGFPVKSSGTITLKDSILSADNVSVKTDQNKILVDGRITEPFNLKWDVNAKNIGQLIPGFKGSVVGKGVATGTTFEPRGFGKLKIKGLSGEGVTIDQADIDLQAGTRNSLVAGKGKAKIRNFKFQDYKIALADIDFDGTDIDLQTGSQPGFLAGKGKAKIKDFQFKDFRLAAADIDFDGKEQKSLLEGKGVIRLQQLKSKQLELSSAKIDFDGSEKFLNLSGPVKQLKLIGQRISSAQLDAKGTIESHSIKLVGKSKQGNLDFSAKGGWLADNWKGTINKINLTKTETGNWSLQKPVRINLANDAFSGSEICIVNPQRGRLCADTEWNTGSGIASKGKLFSVPLAQFKPWLPSNVGLLGTVNAVFDVKYINLGLSGRAEFQLPDSYVELETADGKKEKLAYRAGIVQLDFKDKKVDVKVTFEIDKRGKFVSQSTVTLAPKTGKHRIKGEARFDMTELGWAQDFFPDITRLNGKITSKVKFNGLLTDPEYSGEVELKNGRFSIPDTGTELSNIALLIKSTQPNVANIKGSLTAKSGKLNINGAMKINKLNDWVADLNLKGNNLLFMNTHEVQAYASPDLGLKITPGLVNIKGTFHIPKARVSLSELPETAIYESDDVVFAGDKKNNAKEDKPLRILPNVAITMGDNIRFTGFGLASKLKGRFHVSHNRNNLISRGTLKIQDGEYRAYGQRLTIEHGVLVFNGPLDNPGLDIRATRGIDDIKVGINLAGTLQKPTSSIFSDPPQAEADALSYLITGQSLSETSGDQTQLLVQAVRTLGINSGSTMLNRLGGSIGLDDVNIITYGDYKKNKLQLGKRLGSKLYIRYITGLFDTFHKIAVDYKLGSKWSLQAESGEDQGIDFIYDIDTD